MHLITPYTASLVSSHNASEQTPACAVGCFKLNAAKAMTLSPSASGQLRIAHGRVWVTFANAALDLSACAVDHFLEQGDMLRLAGGQQVVMEAVDAVPNPIAYFCWEPDAVLHAKHAAPHQQTQRVHEVRPALIDLRVALHQAGWALTRLMQGLASSVASAFQIKRA